MRFISLDKSHYRMRIGEQADICLRVHRFEILFIALYEQACRAWTKRTRQRAGRSASGRCCVLTFGCACRGSARAAPAASVCGVRVASAGRRRRGHGPLRQATDVVAACAAAGSSVRYRTKNRTRRPSGEFGQALGATHRAPGNASISGPLASYQQRLGYGQHRTVAWRVGAGSTDRWRSDGRRTTTSARSGAGSWRKISPK
jgi:hypothetical protein